MKTLVVWYSRTGNTRILAHRIAVALDAETEEIVDRANRRGILGYLRSGSDAWFGRRAEILPSRHDPSAFDLVIVGSPVWRASPSSPVRTYLEDHAAHLPLVAFFCTLAGFGSARAFRLMQQACGRRPVATLARTERQLASPNLSNSVDAFVAKLRATHVLTSLYGIGSDCCSPLERKETSYVTVAPVRDRLRRVLSWIHLRPHGT